MHSKSLPICLSLHVLLLEFQLEYSSQKAHFLVCLIIIIPLALLLKECLPGRKTSMAEKGLTPPSHIRAGVGGASRARYLSQLSTHHQVHSLPARMEDDIILTDDIVLCERDGPNSLPHIPIPLPNTPSPSATATNQHPASIFATTVSTGIGGASPNNNSGGGGGGGGGEPNAGASGSRSLGVEVCRAPGCSMQKMCLWHKFVLGYPQYVIWEAATKTVVLDKNNSASFGFKYKVKKYVSVVSLLRSVSCRALEGKERGAVHRLLFVHLRQKVDRWGIRGV